MSIPSGMILLEARRYVHSLNGGRLTCTGIWAYNSSITLQINPVRHRERQTLGLLDALAGICVSQGEGEAYASAMETGPETCIIFIIGNHEEVPQVTQDYLNDVCRQLTDVAHLTDIVGLLNPSIDDLSPRTQDSIGDIYKKILSFTFDNFLTRLTKWNSPWLMPQAHIDHRLFGAEKNRFQELANAINDLYEVATFRTRDVEMVVEVLATLSRSWKLNNPNTLAFIRELDLLPTASDQADAPFLIERYLRKVLKTFNETSKLIRFAVSPRAPRPRIQESAHNRVSAL
ncbi:hypothetical protein ARMSODRAFT_973903 [Armillaria solidipes]|uniref:Uncharacterized protein n=1 Tax=Armillaria solidipes TaxID=1076256 RepID=A0A2H3BWZ1_9AGAR|nr:hypothetical protein ARMSODRAFT_973903 [Armillaria solidipes]